MILFALIYPYFSQMSLLILISLYILSEIFVALQEKVLYFTEQIKDNTLHSLHLDERK